MTEQMILAQIHLIRPWWLLALIPAIFIILLLWRQDSTTRRLSGIISSHLLQHLLIRPQGRSRIRPIHLLGIVLALMVAALTGPAWHREPLPFTEDEAPLILALDLSESMDSEDIKPSRLERAKQKIRDLLALRAGARTGMIAYAGSAHMVLPLTDDPNVLETYLDALSTSIMPTPGKNASKALRLAREMLVKETAAGTILFITDGIETQHISDFVERLSTSEHALATLIVNLYANESDESSGTASLNALSKRANMRTTVLTVDDDDVRRINAGIQSHMRHVQDQDDNQRWRDAGYWLILPILVLACVWFRRGWSIRWAAAVLLLMFYQPNTTCAGEFRFLSLWLTPNQQGRHYFDRGDYLNAAERFEDPLWKGTAYYAAEKFDEAIVQFERLSTAQGFYNLGNAYAHKEDYTAAFTAYEKALSLKKDYPEARFNLEYIRLLIPKPEEQEEGPPGDPTFDPDEIKFDEKGKKGKEGEIEQAQLTDEQVADLWMRRIQTSPAQFLRLKFSYQLQMREGEKTTYKFREMDVAELSQKNFLSATFRLTNGTRQTKNMGSERIIPEGRSREKNSTKSQNIESQ